MVASRLVQLLVEEGDLTARARALEEAPAEAVIRAAIDGFGPDVVVGTAFGAGGLCVLHMAQAVDPDVSAYYIDTGFAFPETNALVERWARERKLKLTRVLPILTPDEQAARHGEALWARDPDRCCALRKVEPNERFLEGKKVWITALRRDESPSRANVPMLSSTTLSSGHRLLKLCPIVRWTRKDVWRYIFEHELPYNPLHDRGYPSVGCTHCTHPVEAGGDERSGRWAGSAKLECGLHVASGE